MTTAQDIPRFKFAEQRILKWIRTGKFSPGSQLPNEQAMADELGMNHRTVRRGLEELVKAGIVEKRPRVGNFVRGVRPRELTDSIVLACPKYKLDLPDQHPAIGAIISGMCRALDRRDFSVGTMSYAPGRLWDDIGPTLVERGVRGMILFPQRDITVEEIRKFEDAGVRVVLIGETRDISLDSAVSGAVTTTIMPALEQILQRLIDVGHRRIVMTTYMLSPHRRSIEQLVRKFMDRYEFLGTPDDFFFALPNVDKVDMSRLDRLFTRQVKPTAIIAHDEVMLAELFRISYRRGIAVPRQLSLAGLSNCTPLMFPVEVASTNTLRCLQEMSEMAARRLALLLDGKRLDEPFLRLDEQVIWGQSIVPPPAP
ncbi:MAG: GntR family transcriptional regulator [Phycisphaeraceae bacterium]|nr:GntR family transcriptional regulator [Phycisphaeraceae bacterium]